MTPSSTCTSTNDSQINSGHGILRPSDASSCVARMLSRRSDGNGSAWSQGNARGEDMPEFLRQRKRQQIGGEFDDRGCQKVAVRRTNVIASEATAAPSRCTILY